MNDEGYRGSASVGDGAAIAPWREEAIAVAYGVLSQMPKHAPRSVWSEKVVDAIISQLGPNQSERTASPTETGSAVPRGPDPGSGTYEWGTLTFRRSPYRSGMARWPIEVELDEDGTVIITWAEQADDMYGTCDRRVRFSAEEFEQMIRVRRGAMATDPARSAETPNPEFPQ